MNMKEFGPRGGARVPGASLRSANGVFKILSYVLVAKHTAKHCNLLLSPHPKDGAR